MKHSAIRLVVISLAFNSLGSCSSMEEIAIQNPYIYNLGNSGCLSHRDWDADNAESRSEGGKGEFEMIIEGNTAKCKFVSLWYPCDYGQVNVKIAYSEGIMTLVEYPETDTADCRCEVDASFTIENMPRNDFILKIYHADTYGDYDVASPKYEGRINQTDSKILIPY